MSHRTLLATAPYHWQPRPTTSTAASGCTRARAPRSLAALPLRALYPSPAGRTVARARQPDRRSKDRAVTRSLLLSTPAEADPYTRDCATHPGVVRRVVRRAPAARADRCSSLSSTRMGTLTRWSSSRRPRRSPHRRKR
eukprot:7146411-Prymnesium_polylepis.1